MFPTASRIADIISRGESNPGSLSSDELGELAAAFSLTWRVPPHQICDDYLELASGNDLQQDIALLASSVPLHSTNALTNQMLLALERDPTFFEAAHAAMNLTIPRSDSKVAADALSPMGRFVLTELVASSRIWDYDMTLADRLAERGLPTLKGKVQWLLSILPDDH